MDELTKYALGLVLGAIGGAVGTLAALRTRLAMMGRDNKDTSERVTRLEERIDARLDRMDKAQQMQLRIIAGMARHAGTDQRWDDVILRYLAEEHL